MLLVIITTYWFIMEWLKRVRIMAMVILFNYSRRLFKLLTFGRINLKKFYNKHVVEKDDDEEEI